MARQRAQLQPVRDGAASRHSRRWELMLRAAYDSRRRGVASAVLERSGRWLDTARAFIAAAFLWAQNVALGQLLVAAQRRPPSFALLRLAWDETGQQMTLKSSATAQVMQVMQLRLALVVAWGPKTWSCKVCVPPQLIPGVSAEALFAAMQSRTVAPILAAARSICNLAEVAVEVMETDAASGNEKLCANLLRQSGSLWCWKQCSLHQHQLVQVQLLSFANGPGFNMLSRLFSITTFLRMGGYFTNMVQSIFAVVSHRLVVLDVRLHGRPPASAQGFSQEVCSYVNRWRMQPRARSQREPEDEAEGEAPIAPGAFEQLAELLNGPWYEAGMVHYCDGRRP